MSCTFLEEKQIFGGNGIFSKNALDIFDKIGTKAAITDFSILLGGYVSSATVNDSGELEDRTGWYWTKTPYTESYAARAVADIGDRN